ncbi:16S rRNA (guanine(966)-N(2))-methyltransferase [Erwinia tracheiphila]|uniref:Ribosomal RNA small subunit methyltransferase D n=1 Tax=Erwinia tracheiphila TaxID=65700 RepID=A0A0M2KGM6_9GAMM|nr:16S rRNA (guanine(966)-N(2))-methyltransferase [Erwinia tracheiphila]EOS93657.1 16S rRNA m(2)G966-methyltransferase [Erwinia tracheiphila PSU-1]KKF36462.1 16S rRNA methyltransferase [Erwinia tracheiphila]UIA87796.1 16S rRNA (guanine(966)-N(2))-methyltransferase [Erwinia tracheiphila]UIA96160.1 16S rRNA (guanine(966)-N(2))-methyltransferase [Erwinia tracheiphila]
MTKKNHNGSPGQIRIIGGLWRGRKLPVPDSAGLRPTTDRVRETLFNWLAPDIQGAHCLDCFAGSGALGLEALSRQAASVTLLELERHVAQQLGKNLATLGAKTGSVINTNTLQYLAHEGQPHGVVFVDPPFRQGMLEQTIQLLESGGWLTADALIYVESEVENGPPLVPENWQLHREKIAGQVAYRLYTRRASEREGRKSC